jgi:hypothetical protein
MLAQLNHLGLPCILQASDQGEPVYRHRGWAVVDHVELKDEQDVVLYTVPVMLREADTPQHG